MLNVVPPVVAYCSHTPSYSAVGVNPPACRRRSRALSAGPRRGCWLRLCCRAAYFLPDARGCDEDVQQPRGVSSTRCLGYPEYSHGSVRSWKAVTSQVWFICSIASGGISFSPSRAAASEVKYTTST